MMKRLARHLASLSGVTVADDMSPGAPRRICGSSTPVHNFVDTTPSDRSAYCGIAPHRSIKGMRR